MPWPRLTVVWVMSDYVPQLFTYEEWCALTDEQRDQRMVELMNAVEELRSEHQAHHYREHLLDQLTAERYRHEHG